MFEYKRGLITVSYHPAIYGSKLIVYKGISKLLFFCLTLEVEALPQEIAGTQYMSQHRRGRPERGEDVSLDGQFCSV